MAAGCTLQCPFQQAHARSFPSTARLAQHGTPSTARPARHAQHQAQTTVRSLPASGEAASQPAGQLSGPPIPPRAHPFSSVLGGFGVLTLASEEGQRSRPAWGRIRGAIPDPAPSTSPADASWGCCSMLRNCTCVGRVKAGTATPERKEAKTVRHPFTPSVHAVRLIRCPRTSYGLEFRTRRPEDPSLPSLRCHVPSRRHSKIQWFQAAASRWRAANPQWPACCLRCKSLPPCSLPVLSGPPASS